MEKFTLLLFLLLTLLVTIICNRREKRGADVGIHNPIPFENQTATELAKEMAELANIELAKDERRRKKKEEEVVEEEVVEEGRRMKKKEEEVVDEEVVEEGRIRKKKEEEVVEEEPKSKVLLYGGIVVVALVIGALYIKRRK